MSADNNIVNPQAVHTSDVSNKRTYTVYEIADLLQISRSKAYAFCTQGAFHIIKIGRSVRVSKASFDEWLDNQSKR